MHKPVVCGWQLSYVAYHITKKELTFSPPV